MKRAASLAALAATLLSPAAARAADQYVSRPLTLPRLNAAFDAGLGVGHYDAGPLSFTGPGVNLEAAIGITSSFELGFRTGVRLNDDARFLRADQFGRLYDTETYVTGTDTLANPELRFTGRVLNAEVVEIGLEGRVYLPFEHIGNDRTHFGGAFGAPFLFHFARFVRLDTGAYVITVFQDPFRPAFSVPARLWFQPTSKLWLGPIAALRHIPATNDTYLALGFGLGYQLASFLDFKTQFLFPQINQDRGTSYFGFGAGVEIRIE